MNERGRVLIVDDNPTNVAILEEILEPHYELASAASGEECLQVAPGFRPDLVLLDVMMPGRDGYQTCTELRDQDELRGTKIIMVSARAATADRLRGYECGADDYVCKPFDEDELLSKVQVFMRLTSVEEVDRMKTDILSLISHNTNTPLNGILGSAEILLLDDDGDPAERRQWVQTIADSAHKLHRLFRKVMLLTELTSATFELRRQPARAAEVLDGALEQVAAQAAERGVEITRQLDSAPQVPMDLELMTTALASILDNAVRVSPPGERVELHAAAQDGQLCLSVTDHGPGLDAAQRALLFRPLEASDVAHHAEGDGLSLAIAQQILARHRGSIEVHSEPGAGATFRLHLPCSAPVAETPS